MTLVTNECGYDKCFNILSRRIYDPIISSVDVYDEDGDLIVVADMVYNPSAKSSDELEKIVFRGRMMEDTTLFKSRDHSVIVDEAEFLGITDLTSTDSKEGLLHFANEANGYIGLKPGSELTNNINFLNFLQRNGHIDHQIIGLFMDLSEGSHTHLKIGGYDENTLMSGQQFSFH